MRAWKLFGLVPRMFLHRPRGIGSLGREELASRADQLTAGRFTELIYSARRCVGQRKAPRAEMNLKEEQVKRGLAAQSRVEQGQVSRARQELTGASLAPQERRETFRALQDRRPQGQTREMPREDWTRICSCIVCGVRRLGALPVQKGAPTRCCVCVSKTPKSPPLLGNRGVGEGHSTRNSQVFHVGDNDCTAEARWGGVRGIATRRSFRRLVAKTLARQFGSAVEKVCAPFQFTLSTRADPSNRRFQRPLTGSEVTTTCCAVP